MRRVHAPVEPGNSGRSTVDGDRVAYPSTTSKPGHLFWISWLRAHRAETAAA
jgi:hypothetical protein